MEEYILQAEDRACVLEGDTIELFMDGRTMIFFATSELTGVNMVRQVPTASGVQDALRFAGADSLFSRLFCVLIPRDHPDFAALRAALADTQAPERYKKATCAHDGKGARHEH